MHCDNKVDEAMPSGFPTGRARMGNGETGGEAAASLRRDGCKSAARRLRDGDETSGGTAARPTAARRRDQRRGGGEVRFRCVLGAF